MVVKIYPNTVKKVGVYLTYNPFEFRLGPNRLGSDICTIIKFVFNMAYNDNLTPVRLNEVVILPPTNQDELPKIKLFPEELQKYLQINWTKV
jgi:hypothetical protein